MKLHYVPYVPNRYEAFILSNRKILAYLRELPGEPTILCVANLSRAPQAKLARIDTGASSRTLDPPGCAG